MTSRNKDTKVEVSVPEVGEVLIHRFRRRDGEVRAEVIYVDRERRIVRVRMDGKEYGSLSGAAKAAAGTSQNGWIYWGLKKQMAKSRDD